MKRARTESRQASETLPGEGGCLPQVSEVVRKYWGFDVLRPMQAAAIQAGIEGRDCLVVLPTGGGKSLCYQVPPLVSGKLTVVISPLIALMKDQVDGLVLRGVPAAALNSGVPAAEAASVRRRMDSGELKLLLVAPERLLGQSDEDGQSAGSALLSQLARLHDRGMLGQIAIDEAHCISQWGHDFRPEYRRLSELRGVLPDVAMLACTATATPRVREDIAHQLDLREPEVLVGIFDRPNLTYRVVPRTDPAGQIAAVLERHIGSSAGAGEGGAIVYCLSRNDTETIAGSLQKLRVDARAYHAGLSPKERTSVQNDFKSEKLSVVVATVAFGMGIDRPNVRCVVHATMPKSVEAYQQETGRAGRDGLAAECVLLYSGADLQRWSGLVERSARESGAGPEFVEAQMALLREMSGIAAGFSCRHRSLSAYFGQEYERSNCQACDVCLGEGEIVSDGPMIARKILSCVARIQLSGKNYGAAHLVGVLIGSKLAAIVNSGHDQLSTFGILKDIDKAELASFVHQLVDAGLLARASGQYPTIGMTTSGASVMRGGASAGSAAGEVVLYRSKRIDAVAAGRAADRAAGTESLSVQETALFQGLRAVRKAIAERLGVPPFVVFGDETLRELVRKRPSTRERMLDVKGIGQRKLEQFAEEFLAAISEQCRLLGLALDAGVGFGVSGVTKTRVSSPTADLVPADSRALTPRRVMAYDLFKKGESIAGVARVMTISESTACQYLADYLEHEKLLPRPESIDPWVPQSVQTAVNSIIDHLGTSSMLRPIFDQLGGTHDSSTNRPIAGKASYEQIKIVLAFRRSRA